MDPTRPRLEIVDVEGVGVDVAVPADHVQGVIVEPVVLEAAAHPDDQLEVPRLAMGLEVLGRMQVAMRERRRLEQLPVAVPVAIRGLELARRVEDEHQLSLVLEAEPVGGPPRDDDVVVLAVGQGAEHRLQLTGALVHEDQLVAVATSVEGFGLLDGAAERALEAHHLLDQQAAVGAELRVPLARQLSELVIPHRFPLLSCSRSIASKSALKLPSPKPRAPCRSITSKKSVGRSCAVFVKIWSRYPSSSRSARMRRRRRSSQSSLISPTRSSTSS